MNSVTKDDKCVEQVLPLVSIVILTYNQQKILGRAIDSVLKQELNGLVEIIIAEDCSTDNTRNICLDYKNKHPQTIRLLLQPYNKGVMRNYFDALALCKGEFIAALAGDDYWSDIFKLQKQIEYFINHPNIGLVYTDFDQYNESTGVIVKNCFESGVVPRITSFEEMLLTRGYLGVLTWMFRSKFSPNKLASRSDYVDESFVYALDMFKLSKIGYIPDSTAVRVIRQGSLSYQIDKKKKFAQEKGVFEIQKDYIQKYNVSQDLTELVYSDNYFRLYQLALDVDNSEFISEANAYFKSHNISITYFLKLEMKYKKYEHYYHKIEPLIDNRLGRYIKKLFIK